MIINKIYSNKESMKDLRFPKGLSFIYGDVEDSEGEEHHEHNLGKTSLVHLIDFMMLKSVTKDHMFKKYEDKFKDWIFFMELEVEEDSYITIKRIPSNPNEVSFKIHTVPFQDYRTEKSWDYENVPLDSRTKEDAIEILNKILNFDTNKDDDYRHFLPYMLRHQDDYRDSFRPEKYEKAKDIEWKPQLFDLLGLKSKELRSKYTFDDKVKLLSKFEDLEGREELSDKDIYSIKEAIREKERERDALKEKFDKFDFHLKEQGINQKLVQEIEGKISILNSERYQLTHDIEKIKDSLKIDATYDLGKLKSVFSEAELFFPKAIEKSYEDLIKFNEQLSTERAKQLKNLLKKDNKRLIEVQNQLKDLNAERTDMLSVLQEGDTFKKYQALQSEIIKINSHIDDFKRQLDKKDDGRDTKEKIKNYKDKSEKLAVKVRQTLDQGSLLYDGIKDIFADLYQRIMKNRAYLYVYPNTAGNPSFETQSFNSKISGSTGEGDGHTATKVMCAAFAIALIQTYLSENKKFFRFAYFDGLLESWGKGPKTNFIELARDITVNNDFQIIVSIIKSDVPDSINIAESEIVIRLDSKNTLFGIPF